MHELEGLAPTLIGELGMLVLSPRIVAYEAQPGFAVSNPREPGSTASAGTGIDRKSTQDENNTKCSGGRGAVEPCYRTHQQ